MRGTALLIVVLALGAHGLWTSSEPQVEELGKEQALLKAENDAQMAQDADEVAADAENQAKFSLAEASERARVAKEKEDETQGLLKRIEGEADELGAQEEKAARIAAAEADERASTLLAAKTEMIARNRSVANAAAEQAAEVAEQKEVAANNKLQEVEAQMNAQLAAKRARDKDKQASEEAKVAVSESEQKLEEIKKTQAQHEKERLRRIEVEKECAVKENQKLKDTNKQEKRMAHQMEEMNNQQSKMDREKQQLQRMQKETTRARKALEAYSNITHNTLERKRKALGMQLRQVGKHEAKVNASLGLREQKLEILENQTQTDHARLEDLSLKLVNHAHLLKVRGELLAKQNRSLIEAQKQLHKDVHIERAQKRTEEEKLQHEADALRKRELNVARKELEEQFQVHRIEQAAKTAADKKQEAVQAANDAKNLLAELSFPNMTMKGSRSLNRRSRVL